jgi:hypothetical protein
MIVAAASAAFLLGASLASAETLMGRVVAKDVATNTLTIQTDAGEQVVLQTSGAAIRAEGADVQLDRVQVGDRVRVETDDAMGETGAQRAATAVEVTPAATAATPGAETPEAAGTETGTAESARTDTAATEADEMDEPADEGRFARLPDTAGPLPLIGLAGLAALAAGFVLRRSRS